MRLITPKEMQSLKTLAAGNLEAALLAAARFGATKSNEAAIPIKRAVEMLEFDAECMKDSHTIGGKWNGESEAKQDYDERKATAKQLRELIEVK